MGTGTGTDWQPQKYEAHGATLTAATTKMTTTTTTKTTTAMAAAAAGTTSKVLSLLAIEKWKIPEMLWDILLSKQPKRHAKMQQHQTRR